MFRMKKNKSILFGILIGVGSFLLILAVVCIIVTKTNRVKEQTETLAEEKQENPKTKAEEEANTPKVVESLTLAGNVERNAITISFDKAVKDYVPCVEAYSIEPDCSNVFDIDRYYLNDAEKKLLSENGFFVYTANNAEFFDTYEFNRYSQHASFVTTDSMMHTYHLYFAMLQKNTEKQYLNSELIALSKHMYENSLRLEEQLKGSEWENAAAMNVAYFTIGALLSGNDVDVPGNVKDIVNTEMEFINAADSVHHSVLIDEDEDYSQYKPRGYYEGDEELEKYFRTMMWYGRRNFKQSEEEENRIALLINLTMDDEAYTSWEKIYSVTAFFAGASDDSGYCEYKPLINQAYGENMKVSDIIGNEKGWAKYQELISTLEPPAINSAIFNDNEGVTDRLEDSKGFRFMGQRFSVDAAVFTQLCYSKVKENSDGEYRMLPDALDVPAALGSDEALSILEDNGNFEYKNYEQNMNKVKETLGDAASDSLWNASLYGGWLHTLSPLLKEKGAGYPSFMTNKAWTRKSLESYLGSYTELKHDTILYSKQFMAEMGGGDDTIYDDRGYVEPEPELFYSLQQLSLDTISGLEGFGLISDADKENMMILANMSEKLGDISIKELTCESLTDEEFDFIREYGGNLEHLWRKTITDKAEDEYVASEEYPCALIADIATDPNGYVLEEALGGASTIYVVFPLDGELHIGKGSVFSYYQFNVEIPDRMTDSDWRRKIGMEMNDDMEYNMGDDVPNPEWTDMYRYKYVYEGDY